MLKNPPKVVYAPPNSPDLNPFDYSVWSVAESKTCKTSHRNVDELKASVVEVWSDLDEAYIRKTFAAFWPRVEAVDKNMSGLI